ncbi:MAG: hypothetical protein FWG24_05435 [Eggerthellaceae bacterium]|nr:hypothetical protein [Eggerthellaceae bacterium]
MPQVIAKKTKIFFLTIALICGFVVVSLINTPTAFADNTNIDELLSETGARLEETAKAYDEAVTKVEALKKEIEDNEKKISELEAEIPVQEEKGAVAMKSLYKRQQEGFSLINMILESNSLDEFLSSIDYINTIHQSNVNEVVRLRVLKSDLEETKQALEDNKAAADAEMVLAQETLKEAQEAREAAQRLAAEEAARRAAALDAEARQQSGGGIGGPIVIGGVDWALSRDEFVNAWAARIDAYLAGSPLTGQGRTFAAAAWNYGVDPRFSPAISCIESSKGRYCFLQHNAWGWGNISWGSWEDAIDTHVRGLANGYGGTVSVWGAQKYCPPNWEHWYSSVSSEMSRI